MLRTAGTLIHLHKKILMPRKDRRDKGTEAAAAAPAAAVEAPAKPVKDHTQGRGRGRPTGRVPWVGKGGAPVKHVVGRWGVSDEARGATRMHTVATPSACFVEYVDTHVVVYRAGEVATLAAGLGCVCPSELEHSNFPPAGLSGVDIGGVIREDTMLDLDSEGHPVVTEEIPGAFDALRALTTSLGSDRVVVISKARENMQRLTLAWFDDTRFFERTGIPRRNVFFTRDRDGKGPIAHAKHVTAMVDDRLDCIRFVQESCPGAMGVWFAAPDKVAALREPLPADVTVCNHWPTIVATLLGHAPADTASTGAGAGSATAAAASVTAAAAASDDDAHEA